MNYSRAHILLPIFFAGLISCQRVDKKSITSSSSAFHNIDSTQSFTGTYSGITPCADCPGIETTVLFKPGSVFIEMLKYQERNSSFSDTGMWSISHHLITVSFSKERNQQFFWIKNDSSIAILDANKKIINGKISKFYILKKIE